MKSLIVLLTLAVSFAQAEVQTFTADKMTCGSCVEKVVKKVCQPMMKAKKLDKCDVSVGEVVVEAEKVNVSEIKVAMEKAGYPVTAVNMGAPKTGSETNTSEKPATN
ncbi:MAG: heavy-metal-associated domain-containing protein [Bdellovibrionales bacterium]